MQYICGLDKWCDDGWSLMQFIKEVEDHVW